jgi:cyclopropane fatty-acyl-phospholipid synthase-like methyltransferase
MDKHVESHPLICDYEGSDYQQTFWERGQRTYEDEAEALALRRLLPGSGMRLLEIGAGAGRNSPRYRGFEQVVLLDASRSQLRQAKERLGGQGRYRFVVGDAYRLPFTADSFDAANQPRLWRRRGERWLPRGFSSWSSPASAI